MHRSKTVLELLEEAKKDDNTAFATLEILANGSPSNTDALTTLGTCYFNGYGVTQNYKTAHEFYSKAAEAGGDLAMYYLGSSFENGFGIDKNLSVATYWYRRAKSQMTTETKDINTAATRLAVLASAESKEVKIPPDSDIDKQVVIDCIRTGTAFSLLALISTQKWNSSRADTCHLLRNTDLLNKTEQLDHLLENKKTGLVRIYIVGHCWIASDFLEDDNGNKIHFNQLAEALKYFINDRHVVINLIACCAGEGLKPNHEDSFGAQLHLALGNLTKKDIPVVARTSLTIATGRAQKKATFNLSRLKEHKPNYNAFLTSPESKNLSLYLNKQPGSKVTFMLDEKKQQIRIDSYKEKLRKDEEKQQIKYKEELRKTEEAYLIHRNKIVLELFAGAKKGDNTTLTTLERLANGSPSNIDALTILGTCYFNGYAITRDYKKAYAFYDKAAKAGDDLAKYSLGMMFQFGWGVTAAPLIAAYWYSQAAKSITPITVSAIQQLEILANASPPNPAILTTLGDYYYFGQSGLSQNDVKAIELYSKASLYNYGPAMYYLGSSFENGFGVDKNLSVATYWYRRAKSQMTTETKDINTAATRLAVLASAESNNEVKIPPDSDVAKQVVIDCLGTGATFSHLALIPTQKWNSSRADKCLLLHSTDLLNKTEQLDHLLENKETGLVRIYITGHCGIASDFLEDADGNKIHFNQLAEALKYFINDRNVVINLIATCGGKGLKPNHEDSFGAKLHLALGNLTKKDIPVVARTSLIGALVREQRKGTFKLLKLEEYKTDYDAINTNPERMNPSFYLNKQPDSKVTFMFDEKKQQIKIDSYSHQEKLRKQANKIRIKAINQWKSHAISNLAICIKNTSVKDKKELLTSWLSLFNSGQPEEKIYRLIQREFINSDSALRLHNRSISKFFNRPTDTMRDLKIIIESGQELFNTTHHSHLSTSPTH